MNIFCVYIYKICICSHMWWRMREMQYACDMSADESIRKFLCTEKASQATKLWENKRTVRLCDFEMLDSHVKCVANIMFFHSCTIHSSEQCTSWWWWEMKGVSTLKIQSTLSWITEEISTILIHFHMQTLSTFHQCTTYYTFICMHIKCIFCRKC